MITFKTFDNPNPNDWVENDLGLDESGKNLAMLSDKDAVMRIVKHRVQTRKYELQYDMNAGVPYYQTIFDNPFYLPVFVSNLSNVIKGTAGVKSLNYLYPKLDAGRRTLTYSCGVTTIYGEEQTDGRLV